MIRLNVNEMPWTLNQSPNNSTFNYNFDLNNLALNRYPDPEYKNLRGQLAESLGVDYSQISLANGSDELIWLSLSVLLRAGDTVATHAPTFGEYERMADLRGVKTLYAPMEVDFQTKLPNLLTVARRYGAKMVILCRPNNPTGELIPYETLVDFLTAYEGYVLLDEAYIEFAESPSTLPLIEAFPNLVILRTFSKAFGMAGLRLGYSISSAAIAKELNDGRPPYNINLVTESIAQSVLEQPAFFKERIALLKQERDKISEALNRLGVDFFPSASNFILLKDLSRRFGTDGLGLAEKFAKAGIAVRAFKEPWLSDCLRFSLGTPEENRILIKVVESL